MEAAEIDQGTSQTVNSTKHVYYYADEKLLQASYWKNRLDFFYDATGHAYALEDNTPYHHIPMHTGHPVSPNTHKRYCGR